MRKPFVLILFLVLGLSIATSGWGFPFTFTTGNPDGRMGTASRPTGSGGEIESADDFILTSQTTISHATFVGLRPSGASVSFVGVEIYRVFPQDSTNPPTGNVPTRVNSPSDNAFDSRDSTAGSLAFSTTVLNPSFAVQNTVVNGINKVPNQTTGGDGPASGEEVLFDATFATPFSLPAGHYFFRPAVGLSTGTFLWLSAPKPIVAPGTAFSPDLQSWIRNANLDPDWLRVGTDIVGGATPPTYNAVFSLGGTAVAVLVATPVNIATPEGVSFNGTVATFTDNDDSQPAGNFTAAIDWGDGISTPGVIAGSAGSYTISGTHTYADEGAFTVTVTITDSANSKTASSTGTASVAESDVLGGTGLAISTTQFVVFSGAVANFSDASITNVPSDFIATIDWGDGSTTAGVVSGGGGTFAVSGSHMYIGAGIFPITVTLADDAPGTATATVTGSASVAVAPVQQIPMFGGLGLLALAVLLAACGLLSMRGVTANRG